MLILIPQNSPLLKQRYIDIVGNKKTATVLITLICFLVTTCIFFPGGYSNDSWAQLYHAMSNNYDDWFDPGMEYTWHVLLKLTGNYVSLYVLLIALHWLFIGMLVWDMKAYSFRYFFTIGLGMFFLFIPQYVMRDSLLAVYFGVAYLLILKQKRVLNLVLAIVLLLLGLWTRSNTIVVFTFLIYLIFVRYYSQLRYKALLSVVVGLVSIMSFRFINYKVLKASVCYPTYKLKLLDIIGVSKSTGINYLPASVTASPKFNMDTLFSYYSPASIDHIYWPMNERIDMLPFPNQELNDVVNDSWKKCIKNHPLDYLKNRWEGFLYYLRIKKRLLDSDYRNVYIEIDPRNDIGLTQKKNTIRDYFSKVYQKLQFTFFFSPWLWLLLNSGFSLYYWYKFRRDANPLYKIHSCIQLSGLIYILSQLLVYQIDNDFRYTYLSVYIFIIAIAYMERKNNFPAPETPK